MDMSIVLYLIIGYFSLDIILIVNNIFKAFLRLFGFSEFSDEELNKINIIKYSKNYTILVYLFFLSFIAVIISYFVWFSANHEYIQKTWFMHSEAIVIFSESGVNWHIYMFLPTILVLFSFPLIYTTTLDGFFKDFKFFMIEYFQKTELKKPYFLMKYNSGFNYFTILFVISSLYLSFMYVGLSNYAYISQDGFIMIKPWSTQTILWDDIKSISYENNSTNEKNLIINLKNNQKVDVSTKYSLKKITEKESKNFFEILSTKQIPKQ